jgi:phenylalanyl-tRNA synthetase beta chain
MIELCGATVRPGTVDIGGDGPPPPTIRLRDRRVDSLLGTPVPRERSRQILEALEFGVTDAPDGLDVTVPAFRRADVAREADLIEEVARLDGVEKLPATLPSRHGAAGRLTARQRRRRRASDALIAQGLHEVVGWSFTAPDLSERLRLGGSAAESLALANPLSGEQSRLRTTLLGGLLDVARRNRSRGAGSLRLFEAGAVYLATDQAGDPLAREPYHVGALLAGALRTPTWREPDPPPADFFAAKGVLAGLLDALTVPWTAQPGVAHPFLHPGRAAEIVVEGAVVGWLGEVHPLVAEQWELDGTIAAFELDLDALPASSVATYEDLISFPEVREDLAVVVPDRVTAADLLATVREAGHPLLASASVFDVYRDAERIGAGNVSLAVRLSFRAPDRTLTDQDVAAQRDAILEAITDRLGGKLRA